MFRCVLAGTFPLHALVCSGRRGATLHAYRDSLGAPVARPSELPLERPEPTFLLRQESLPALSHGRPR